MVGFPANKVILNDRIDVLWIPITSVEHRPAPKGKINFLCALRNSQIEFRMVANLGPQLASSDLI